MPRRLPTVAEYVKALEAIRARNLAQSVRTMLQKHYSMPNRVVTMRLLADEVGFRSYKTANQVYGGFAGRVKRELGLKYKGISLWTIAHWDIDPSYHLGEFSFQMREAFAAALVAVDLVDINAEQQGFAEADAGAIEGDLQFQLRRHRRRERALRAQKVRQALQLSPDGRLRCEVPRCGFDFEAEYGDIGHEYIQVHHLEPLASRKEASKTLLSELMLVCANCHVMIHHGGENRDPAMLRLNN